MAEARLKPESCRPRAGSWSTRATPRGRTATCSVCRLGGQGEAHFDDLAIALYSSPTGSALTTRSRAGRRPVAPRRTARRASPRRSYPAHPAGGEGRKAVASMASTAMRGKAWRLVDRAAAVAMPPSGTPRRATSSRSCAQAGTAPLRFRCCRRALHWRARRSSLGGSC